MCNAKYECGVDQAFCAGGDVRSIYDANIHNKVTSDATSASRLPVDYFFEEYILMNEIVCAYCKLLRTTRPTHMCFTP